MYLKMSSSLFPVAFLISLSIVYGNPLLDNYPNQITCPSSIPNPVSWLWNQRNNNRCIHLLIDSNSNGKNLPPCFYTRLTDFNYSVMAIDFPTVIHRNIFADNRTNCELFIILSTSQHGIRQLFEPLKDKKRFYPFSQIFIVTDQGTQNSGGGVIDQSSLNYINENALNVYTMDNLVFHNDRPEFHITRMHNVLTGKSIGLPAENETKIADYHGIYRLHSFFNATNRQRIAFRVSMFNCPPYIVYMGKQMDTKGISSHKFDGLEWRFLREITLNWKIQYRQPEKNNYDIWYQIVRNVEINASDLAMCSVWMTVNHNIKFDLSAFFDHQCITFLVPKPMPLNEALNIYLSLNAEVWLHFVLSIIGFILLLCGISKLGILLFGAQQWRDRGWSDLSMSAMNAVNMATAHGVARFPHRHTVKILLTR